MNVRLSMVSPARREDSDESRPLRRLLCVCLALLCFATLLGLAAFLVRGRWWQFSDGEIPNYYLYHEDLSGAFLAILILAGAWLWLWLQARSRVLRNGLRVDASWTVVLGIALGVALVAYLGTHWIFRGFSLSGDEFMTDFDVRIFRAGLLAAPVPKELSPYLKALQPEYVRIGPGNAQWVSMYLPVNAALRALFAWAGDVTLASPALAAISVVLLYLVARQLFPRDRESQLIAVLLLATGMQFLLTAMTPYAMTAHLAFNLAWLWLVLRDRPWSHAGAALVTLAACGLHQVAFHPLFAAPFLVLMVVQRRWTLAAYYGAVFAAVCLFWISYHSLVLQGPSSAGFPAGGGAPQLPGTPVGAAAFLRSAREMARDAKIESLFWAADNIFRFAVWENPVALVLLLAAVAGWRRWTPTLLALAAGLLLTLVFMSFLVPNQGHGRGYRYLHGLLGSTALLGAAGWRELRDYLSVPRAHLWAVLWIAVAGSLAALLPLRAVQTWSLIEPYLAAAAAIRGSDAELVLVDRDGLWFGIDFMRNDPFLRARPLVMDLNALDEAQIRLLCSRYRTEVFDFSNPGAAGVRRTRQPVRQRRNVLYAIGCGTPSTNDKSPSRVDGVPSAPGPDGKGS